MWASLKKWALGWLKGGPHFIVGDPSRPYLKRWYILPRNDWLCIYLHCFCRDDDDRALHDHPWDSVSLVLYGGYREVTVQGEKDWKAGSLIRRTADFAHRIILHRKPDGTPKRCWTLFVTGPRKREWGFWCPQGWVHWKRFTAVGKPGEVGPGCDQGG